MDDYQQIVEFLKAIDEAIEEAVALYVIGGGSITLALDHLNRTEDIDVVGVGQNIIDLAGKQSELAKKYNVYIQKISEIGFTAPRDWRDRAKQINLGLSKLSIFCADIHDVILGKLARMQQKDVDDIMSLYEKNYLDIPYLLQRLNDNKKELLNIEYRNNAKLAFEQIFNKKLIFREGQAKLT